MTDNKYIGYSECTDFSEKLKKQLFKYTDIYNLIKNFYNINCKDNITDILLKTIDLDNKTNETILSLKKNNNLSDDTFINNINSYIKKIELYNNDIIISLYIFNILLIILLILVFKIKSKNI